MKKQEVLLKISMESCSAQGVKCSKQKSTQVGCGSQGTNGRLKG